MVNHEEDFPVQLVWTRQPPSSWSMGCSRVSSAVAKTVETDYGCEENEASHCWAYGFDTNNIHTALRGANRAVTNNAHPNHCWLLLYRYHRVLCGWYCCDQYAESLLACNHPAPQSALAPAPGPALPVPNIWSEWVHCSRGVCLCAAPACHGPWGDGHQ